MKRYEVRCHDCDPEITTNASGKWVRYSDVEYLRAELATYQNAPVLATLGPCCGIVRLGDQSEGVVHSGACREDHGGVLGPTIKLIAARNGEGEV